jgi:hypothetical protein
MAAVLIGGASARAHVELHIPVSRFHESIIGFDLTYVLEPMEGAPPGWHPESMYPGGMAILSAPRWRLATDGWSNPPEQRARTGLNQFVSNAQSVWLGGRTECPHRRRAPEGWQHL